MFSVFLAAFNICAHHKLPFSSLLPLFALQMAALSLSQGRSPFRKSFGKAAALTASGKFKQAGVGLEDVFTQPGYTEVDADAA